MMRRYLAAPLLLSLAALCACNAPASEKDVAAGPSVTTAMQAASTGAGRYRISYRVTPDPEARGARVELRLSQDTNLLRELDMRADPAWISDVRGDGQITRGENRLTWLPPETGGTISWFATINHRRNGDGYDSLITGDWAIFRLDDLLPAASTRTLKGALSDTTLVFDLPRGWSSVTQYFGSNDSYRIDNPRRRFDRPTGWVVLGDIGVRVDEIGDRKVKVAGPTGHSVRRLDILAMLRWGLPEMLRVLPDYPDRLTVISAGDPMWRGGLSAPASLFVHSSRPMISENATSTLLHEVFHVGFGSSAGPGSDWIVEGLAELYSLQALQRSGTISRDRFQAALDRLARRADSAASMCTDSASGAVTARAVTLLQQLDEEIRSASASAANLDDVVPTLAAAAEPITIDTLRSASEALIGGPSRTLNSSGLDDCGKQVSL